MNIPAQTNILAIDTATEACSAALLCQGTITARFELAPRRHAELILPMADALLAEAGIKLNQLDALAFGCGPGAFTGVRIATGVVQGLALAADLPVITVSNLAALAQTQAAGQVAAAFDARMGDVYWGLFRRDADDCMRCAEEQVCRPEAVPIPDNGNWLGAGSGWMSYRDLLQTRFGEKLTAIAPDAWPTAAAMLEIAVVDHAAGKGRPAADVRPVYLRNDVAKTSQKTLI